MGIFKAVGWFVTGGAIRPTTTRERSRLYQRQANDLLEEQLYALQDLSQQQVSASPYDSRPRGTCPACREMIIIGASTCPNCQTSGITWPEAENGGDIGRSLPAWLSPEDVALVREHERKERQLKEQLAPRRSWLSRRIGQKQHDKKLMRLHRNTIEEHGIKSVRGLRLYLGAVEKSNREARERDAEIRMKAEGAQREREAELLRLEAERLRLERASNLASKKMYDSIFVVLHGKVKLKLNPDVGETITRIELIEAFQHAGRQVNAATELIDEHRSAAWEQIGKLAQLLRDEAGWDVSAPTSTGP
jgi:hypothetical protein